MNKLLVTYIVLATTLGTVVGGAETIRFLDNLITDSKTTAPFWCNTKQKSSLY